jgi:tryptophan halogenase
MDLPPINSITILGGGTAGWMAACLMAKRWAKSGIKINLVESPEIGIIGVGEGSTPVMKDFFEQLGISESEWMPECNATYKNGISFKNWSTVPGYQQYFHPFGCSIDSMTYKFLQKNSLLRRKGFQVDAHPDHFFLMAELAKQKLAPIAGANFPFQFDYAYHFDSHLVGKFLSRKAIELGVCHIVGTVKQVLQNENGDIESLELEEKEKIDSDFFIDCSGFASILLQKTLKVGFESFADNLFNDSAIALPSCLTEVIPSQTDSTALTAGWAWKIPLTNRFGNGYVYCSSYIDAEKAEQELRQHVGLLDSDVSAKHIKMKVGQVSQSWSHNCVAIGLSQGFIEPLEATALQFVQSTINEFMAAFEFGRFTSQYRDIFNHKIRKNFDGIRDYIVLHYKTNSRSDSQYWKDNRDNRNISSTLESMLDCWKNTNNLESELKRLEIDRYYTSISWNCLLSGVGLFPASEGLVALPNHIEKVDLEFVKHFMQGCTLNFSNHREVLEELKTKKPAVTMSD